MNIVDPILFQCRTNANQPAICAPGTKHHLVTYGQLEYMINNVTRALLSLGFGPSQVVGIAVQDEIFHIILVLALTRLNVVTASCSTTWIPQEIGAVVVISDSAALIAGAKRIIQANPEWLKGSGDPIPDSARVSAYAGDIYRIFLTSGSTGSPKGVALSHRMLLGRNLQFDYAFGGRWPQHSRIYCDLGVGSEPAFRFTLYMLMRGGMVMFYGDDPVMTEQSLDLFKIESMVSSPRGLAEHLKFYENTNVRCSLDHILAMGGAVPPQLLERVWKRMCPHVFSDYGATEVGSVASADLRDINETPCRTGYIVPPAVVDIVDDNGSSLSNGTEGIVRLQTPYMASGYIGQPEASALAFRDGWFYPGDHGYVTRENLLVITGRLETRINVGGDKINPERIEEVLRAFPGVYDAAVVGVLNALGLEDIHALIRADAVADEAIRAHCQSKLSRNFVPVRFIPVDHIPRSETGKIQRSQLRDLTKSN